MAHIITSRTGCQHHLVPHGLKCDVCQTVILTASLLPMRSPIVERIIEDEQGITAVHEPAEIGMVFAAHATAGIIEHFYEARAAREIMGDVADMVIENL